MAQAITQTSAGFGIVARLQDFVASYRAARAQQVEYNTTYRELDALTDNELADIGVRRADIGDIAKAHAFGK